MAVDLLSTIRHEIDERLSELRPLLTEYERLLVAVDALVATSHEAGSAVVAEVAAPAKRVQRGTQVRVARRGAAAGAIELAVTDPTETTFGEPVVGEPAKLLDPTDVQRVTTAPPSVAKPKPDATKPRSERAARGAAREAILAALDHGSHTVGELAVVTAMSGPNINGNLRRLFSEGAVVKTEREGKTAWALAIAVI